MIVFRSSKRAHTLRAILVSFIAATTLTLQFGVARAEDPALPTDPIPAEVGSQLPVQPPVPWGAPVTIPDSPIDVPPAPTTPHATPAIVKALTGDANGNGRLDLVSLIFNSPMNAGTTPAVANDGGPGVKVEGYRIVAGGIAWRTSQSAAGQNIALPATILDVNLLEGGAPDTDATPRVTYTASGDPNSGAFSSGGDLEADTTTVTTVDQSPPVLLSATSHIMSVADGLLFKLNGDQLKLAFSEPVSVAGTTPVQRWDSLEKAIAFWDQPPSGGGSYCTDAIGLGALGNNFPQALGTTDIIDRPAVAETSSTIVVTMKSGTTASSAGQQIFGYPARCAVSVDAGKDPTTVKNQSLSNDPAQADPKRAGFSKLISDAHGNAATGMAGAKVHKVLVSPEGPSLASGGAKTLDGLDAQPDGKLDGIELTFDTALDPASFTGATSFFSVRAQQGDIPISSITAGSAATKIQLHFSSIMGTDATPTVGYQNPDDCVTGAAGLKGAASFRDPVNGTTYAGCASTFSVVAKDGASPFLTSARTADANSNGRIDMVHVTFSEPLTEVTPGHTAEGSATAGHPQLGDTTGWGVDGYNVEAIIPAKDGLSVDLTVTESTAPDTAARPDVSYTSGTAQDLAANPLSAGTVTAADGIGPLVVGATVYNTDGKDLTNAVVVKFSEDIVDPLAAAAPDFKVGLMYVGTGFAPDDTANDSSLTVTTAVPGTGPTSVAYLPSGNAPILDAAGNAATAIIFNESGDKATPVATISTSKGDSFGPGDVTITATYGEKMAPEFAPVMKIGGQTIAGVSDPAHTNGWRMSDPTKWDGAYTVPAGACSVAAGCVQTITADGAQDPAGNKQAAMSSHDVTVQKDADPVTPPDPNQVVPSDTPDPNDVVPSETPNPSTSDVPDPNDVVPSETPNPSTSDVPDPNDVVPSETPNPSTSDVPDPNDVVPSETPNPSTSDVPDPNDVVPSNTPDPDEVVATLGETLDQVKGEILHKLSGVQPSPSPTPSPGPGGGGGSPSPSPSPSTSPTPTPEPDVQTRGPQTTSSSFVASDSTTDVTWNVDNSQDLDPAEPITIDYSTNGGSTWQPINGGDYSHANDGTEAWHTPSGSSFNTMVRVTAHTTHGTSDSDTAGPFVQGVSGYLVNGRGEVLPYGSADSRTRESATSRSDLFRGIAVRPDKTAGYTLMSDGSVRPFAVGSARMPAVPKYTKLSGEMARGIALRNATTGYVVDAYGRVLAFGGAPAAKTSKTWSGHKYAAGIVMVNGARGGYVLDIYGRMYPFTIGSYKMPPSIRTTSLKGTAVSVAMRRDGRSGWILSNDGVLHAFGGAPSRASQGTGSKAAAASLILITQDGGYWADRGGRLHAWGSAWGNPTRTSSQSRVYAAS